MRKIFKYPILTTDKQQVDLPADAKILHVGVQDYQIHLWAWVDPESEMMKSETIYVFGTGNEIPFMDHDNQQDWAYNHLGTVQIGPFVWHVFNEMYWPYKEKNARAHTIA